MPLSAPVEHSLPYRPEVDALRAVAIIPVVLFHLDPRWISGGYLGVDVFFVISGYLITSILLRDLDRQSFRFRQFYARRIRRLAPVILSVVAATLAVAWLRLTPSEFVFVARQSLAALFSVSNVFLLSQVGDYWGPAAESTALLHTWSLSVEEQFYLIFPFVLAVLHRWSSSRMTRALSLIVLVSVISDWVLSGSRPAFAFYMLPTRAWELGCGGLLASRQRDQWRRRAASVSRDQQSGPEQSKPEQSRAGQGRAGQAAQSGLGIVMILIAYWTATDRMASDLQTWVAVIGTLLVLATPPGTPVSHRLSPAPLVYVGRISYSWYMWHWPLIVLNDLGGFYFGKTTVGLVSLAAAAASYHLIEQPTRRRKGIVPWIGGAFAGCLALAVAAALPRSLPDVDPAAFDRITWYGAYYSAVPSTGDGTGGQGDWQRQILHGVHAPRRESAPPSPSDPSSDRNLFESGGVRVGDLKGPPKVVLLGDSHATMWAHTIAQITQADKQSLAVWAINGYDPLFDPPGRTRDPESIKARYDRARRERLQQWQPELTIISMRWSHRDLSRAKPFVQFVAACSRQVLLIGVTPELRIGDQNARDHLIESGVIPRQGRRVYLPRVMNETMLMTEDQVKQIASEIENVHYVSLLDRYQRGSKALVLDGHRCVYLDDDHLTEYGASLSHDRLQNAIERWLDDH